MPRKQPQLAKLTRPRLHKAVERTRLFALLDEAHARKPAICVVGPPGAGKTTLVASWLDARGIKGIWYQLDPGDTDLATFFYYLREAAKPFMRKGQRPLPALTPEYLQDIEGFSRRFFRELFTRLPEGATLVLDNYQEVDAEQSFHRLIAQAVEEVPSGTTLFAVSRRDPPDAYARLVANENVRLVDWSDLKLSVEEVTAVADLRHHLPKAQLASLHASTGGWAAGVVLALERLGDKATPEDASRWAVDATFDYFASQIFSRLPASTQGFLIRTAYLPHVPVSQAHLLTGNARPVEILEDLYRRHLFVHRRHGAEPSYSYHALFREFLQIQGRKHLSNAELACLQIRTADLLAQSGDQEAAMQLYRVAGAWTQAEKLVVEAAPEFIRQGRWKSVVDWIQGMPPACLEQDHWMLHWFGVAKMATNPTEARGHLEKCFHHAVAGRDELCRVLSAASVIQTYLLEYNHFRPLDAWIDELSATMPRARFPSAESEVRAQSALLTALSFRKPDHPALETCTSRVLALLPEVRDVDLRLSAAVFAFAWGSLSGPVELADRIRSVVESLWKRPEISALNAALAGYILSWYYCLKGDRPNCVEILAELDAIAEREGFSIARTYAATIGAWLELDGCNVPAASQWSRLLEQAMDASRPFDRATSDAIKAWIAFHNRELDQALDHCTRAVREFDEVGSVFHQVVFRQHLAWILLARGEEERVRKLIKETRELGRPLRCVWLEIGTRVTEAIMATEANDRVEAEERTLAVFRFSREQGADHALGKNVRPWMPRLAALAIEAGIEVQYVRKLIVRFGWLPPAGRPESWPWALRIYSLGGLRIYTGDQLLKFGRKTPRKPLGLLMALLAFGEGAASSVHLVDILWPDEEGDVAHHNLNINLHRLRKLLGRPDAVLVEGGKVSLNPALVWTDASYCERLFHEGSPGNEDEDQALQIYRGGFLQGVDDSPWVLLRRNTLRAKHVRARLRTAAHLESGGKFERAISCYLEGIATDPLAEEFYRGLIRCHAAQGAPDKAQSAFHQLRAALQAHGQGLTPVARSLMKEFPELSVS